jgi:hypothetical protein
LEADKNVRIEDGFMRLAASVKLGSSVAFAAMVTSDRIGAWQPFATLRLNSQIADKAAVYADGANGCFIY